MKHAHVKSIVASSTKFPYCHLKRHSRNEINSDAIMKPHLDALQSAGTADVRQPAPLPKRWHLDCAMPDGRAPQRESDCQAHRHRRGTSSGIGCLCHSQPPSRQIPLRLPHLTYLPARVLRGPGPPGPVLLPGSYPPDTSRRCPCPTAGERRLGSVATSARWRAVCRWSSPPLG